MEKINNTTYLSVLNKSYNESEEQLKKLVAYLIKHDNIEASEIAKVLGIPLKEFIKRFLEE